MPIEGTIASRDPEDAIFPVLSELGIGPIAGTRYPAAHMAALYSEKR